MPESIRERLREQGQKLVDAHHWVSKSGRPWSPRVKSDICATCGHTPDVHPPDNQRPGYVCLSGPDALAVALELDTLERRVRAAEELIEAVENACPVCGGDGWTVDHDPSDETGQTPMQVPCWDAEHAVILNAPLSEARLPHQGVA